MNVAVTLASAFSVTLQAPAPEQAPPHAERIEPLPGVAVSTTGAPEAKSALQVPDEQLNPPGLLETLPPPVTVTLRVRPCTKAAETDWSEFMLTLHEPLPLHAPPQPVKIQPALGTGVSETSVPAPKEPLQLEALQLRPAGWEVMLPWPLKLTLSVCAPTKMAVTFWSL